MAASEPEAKGSGPGILRTLAYLVIVLAGLKAAAPFLLPVLLALLIAIVCIPPVRALRRRGIPSGIAIASVVLLVLVALVVLVTVVGSSIADFSASAGKYEERLDELVGSVRGKLEDLGLAVRDRQLSEMVDTKVALRFVASAAGTLSGTLSQLIVVLLLVVFLLLEAGGLPDKLRRALGSPDDDLASFHQALDQVFGYLSVKTVISLVTGILAGLLCAVLGVDFPVLWGLVTFLLNYIPNIGSVLAAIPPVLLALVQHGWGTTVLLVVGFLAINMVLGNVLEPRLMGRRLGLSPLVVFLSLLFWSWLWGPVGMLLSVPLTNVVKILLESRAESRPIAILLGPAEAETD